jgi:hypothetical protein
MENLTRVLINKLETYKDEITTLKKELNDKIAENEELKKKCADINTREEVIDNGFSMSLINKITALEQSVREMKEAKKDDEIDLDELQKRFDKCADIKGCINIHGFNIVNHSGAIEFRGSGNIYLIQKNNANIVLECGIVLCMDESGLKVSYRDLETTQLTANNSFIRGIVRWTIPKDSRNMHNITMLRPAHQNNKISCTGWSHDGISVVSGHISTNTVRIDIAYGRVVCKIIDSKNDSIAYIVTDKDESGKFTIAASMTIKKITMQYKNGKSQLVNTPPPNTQVN